MSVRLSAISSVTPDLLTTARLVVETAGEGFTDITREAARFVRESGAGDGLLLLFLRHTSASLTIQENADPDVQADLLTSLRRLAPQDGPWVHTVEGPDDMPAHLRAALTQVQISIPLIGGRLALGSWQGIYLFEHRRRAQRRTIALHLLGA